MIEITKGQSTNTYRISPDDPCIVERRQNKHGAHWRFWLRRDSATEAKLELIRLGRQDDASRGEGVTR